MSLILLVRINQVVAQPQQAFRLELPAKVSDRSYDIISMGSEGLALIRDLNKYSQGKKKWQVDLVDTTLTRFWSTELDLENRLTLVGFEHVPGQLYLLFRETQTTFNNFQLLTLDIQKQSVTTDKVRFDLSFQLSHFTVAGTGALFGGYISNEPAVLLYNHSSDHPKLLPGLFAKNISLLDVRANQNQSFNVLFIENLRTDKCKLIVRTYDPEGNMLVDDIITVDPRFTILSGVTSRLIHEEMMIVGTYGERTGNQALGIYSVVVDPFTDQPIRYTDLASLDHFLDYLPEKKSRNMMNKVSKEKSQGKTPGYKVNLLPIRLEEQGDSFYLFSEMFRTASNVTYVPYSNPSSNNYYSPYQSPGYPYRSSAYDNPSYSEPTVRNAEVRMIQSVLLRFKSAAAAPQGLSMKFEEVKRPALDQTGDFVIAKDSAVLVYKKKNEIFYQRESGDPMLRPTVNKANTLLLHSTDVLKDEDEESNGLRFWYTNHLYCWGYRRVTATVGDDVQSRYVFYVNRLDF